MEHDDVCREHAKDQAALKAEFVGVVKMLNDAVDRWQKLVDQFHEQNITSTRIEGNLNALVDRVPKDLPEKLMRLETSLGFVGGDVKSLRGQWGWLVKLVLAPVVLAIIAFALKGGFK